MSRLKIAIVNESVELEDTEIVAVIPALQRQVREHFAPAWGLDAELSFVPRGRTPPRGSAWMIILDGSDDAAALGYHDRRASGRPLGKVFARTDREQGASWTVSLSHEILEMIADPDINLCALVRQDAGPGLLYSYEVCDPCQSDRHAYRIDGVLVSDFVLPEWFEPTHARTRRTFDYRGLIKRPLTVLPGGYIGVLDLERAEGWQQLEDARGSRLYAHRPTLGSRRERRRIPPVRWLRSAPLAQSDGRRALRRIPPIHWLVSSLLAERTRTPGDAPGVRRVGVAPAMARGGGPRDAVRELRAMGLPADVSRWLGRVDSARRSTAGRRIPPIRH